MFINLGGEIWISHSLSDPQSFDVFFGGLESNLQLLKSCTAQSGLLPVATLCSTVWPTKHLVETPKISDWNHQPDHVVHLHFLVKLISQELPPPFPPAWSSAGLSGTGNLEDWDQTDETGKGNPRFSAPKYARVQSSVIVPLSYDWETPKNVAPTGSPLFRQKIWRSPSRHLWYFPWIPHGEFRQATAAASGHQGPATPIAHQGDCALRSLQLPGERPAEKRRCWTVKKMVLVVKKVIDVYSVYIYKCICVV